MGFCLMCDSTYDDANAAEVEVHEHQEPQSGPPRDAWLKSRLSYSRWITETKEGAGWSAQQKARGAK